MNTSILFENKRARFLVDLAKLLIFLFSLFLGFFDYLIYLSKLDGYDLSRVEDIVYTLLDRRLAFFSLGRRAGALALTLAFALGQILSVFHISIKPCPAQ